MKFNAQPGARGLLQAAARRPLTAPPARGASLPTASEGKLAPWALRPSSPGAAGTAPEEVGRQSFGQEGETSGVPATGRPEVPRWHGQRLILKFCQEQHIRPRGEPSAALTNAQPQKAARMSFRHARTGP